jgi:hypothetical protein
MDDPVLGLFIASSVALLHEVSVPELYHLLLYFGVGKIVQHVSQWVGGATGLL